MCYILFGLRGHAYSVPALSRKTNKKNGRIPREYGRWAVRLAWTGPYFDGIAQGSTIAM